MYKKVSTSDFPSDITDIRAVSKRSPALMFVLGLVFGLCFSLIIVYNTQVETTRTFAVEFPKNHSKYSENRRLPGSDWDASLIDLTSHEHTHENHSLKDQLYDEVRVLCWVLTSPGNVKTKAKHVVNTWGRRCNKLLLMSSKADNETENVVPLPVLEGHDKLWAKTKEALKYIYLNHLDDADWFLKADDDTYVVVENVRYLLYQYPTEYPIYFGFRFKIIPDGPKQGYMSGGAGYAMSKTALKRFVEVALPNKALCRPGDKGAEDLELGICLLNVNVTAGDSRDFEKRKTFFPFHPEDHLRSKVDDSWYWHMSYYENRPGFDCCSDFTISFHYITPIQMYVLEFLIYHLTPFGIATKHQTLPKKMTYEETEIHQQHLDEPWTFKMPETEQTAMP